MESADKVLAHGPSPVPRGSNRACLWVAILVLLVGGCVCGLGCGGIFALVFGILHNSEPYQMALREAQNSAELKEQLGEPITEAIWFPTGKISRGGGRGEATLSFKVSGPEGRATIYTDARFEAGRWTLTRLTAEVERREQLDLLPAEPGGP